MSFLFRRGNTNLYSWPVRADYSQEPFIAFQREVHLHFVDGASSSQGFSVFHHFIDQFMAMDVSVLHHFMDQFMLTILLVQILACSSC